MVMVSALCQRSIQNGGAVITENTIPGGSGRPVAEHLRIAYQHNARASTTIAEAGLRRSGIASMLSANIAEWEDATEMEPKLIETSRQKRARKVHSETKSLETERRRTFSWSSKSSR